VETITPRLDGTAFTHTTTVTLTAGAASALTSTVSRAPASITANGSATSALTVQLKDVNGNNLTGSSGTVTFATPTLGSIAGVTDVGNGTWTATYTAGTVAGVETITPRLDGTAFTNTTTVTLVAGAASQLVFTQQPSGVVSGATMSPAVTVAVQDVSGNTVTTASGTVTLALTVPGGATLIGGGPATVTSGVATFGGLSVDRAGSYTLTPTTTVSGVTALPASSSFAVSASQLVLTTFADGATSGAIFATQPVVAVRDAAGNTVATDNSTVVTMTVSTGATVVGIATATASSGVATFDTVGVSGTAGTSYMLTFASGTLTPATQSITPTAGRATRLLFDVQPSDANANVTISPPVVVRAVDDAGNTDANFSDPEGVTLYIEIGPPGADDPTGGIAVAAMGVATFSGLSLNTPGDYQLIAVPLTTGGWDVRTVLSVTFTIH
jgi:hypothetical protein